jgi:hypothetical protein
LNRCRGVLAAALACALGTLAACGGSSAQNQQAVQNLGPGIGSSIRTADCADWRAATTPERLATVGQLRDFFGGPVSTGQSGPEAPGPVLDDQRAYELLDGYCQASFASAFKLYKLYGRAAAFAGQTP